VPGNPEDQRFMICLASYLLIYLGIGCALGRWCAALSHDIRPGHVRVLTLILFAVGCIGPYVPLLFQFDYGSSYHPVMITNPLATLLHVADDRAHSPFIVPVLVVGAGLAVAVNLLAMFRGVREVVLAENGTTRRSASPVAASTT
jgi:threonine dehydrogenase-like Zn-dependent dehydrogenase